MDRLFQDYLKGLTQYCDPVEILNSAPSQDVYDSICVVPLAGEFDSFVYKTLPSICRSAEFTQNKVLLIAVINSSHTRSQLNTRMANDALLKYFLFQSEQKFKWIARAPKLDICVLNFESGNYVFGPKEGVGLARKIGTDLGVYIISKHRAQWNFIYNTDGDAEVPLNYFKKLPTTVLDSVGALVFPFQHTQDPTQDSDQNKAGMYYDFYLRYFYEGMKYSKSCFSYIPIGSCLMLNPLRYTQVRGFPNRLAGEDFYILSKIAKISRVENLQTSSGEAIQLESRLSDRVPFGTGATLTQWTPLIKNKQEDQIKAENPMAFYALKRVLEYLKTLSHSPSYFSLNCFLNESDFSKSDLFQTTLEKVFHAETAFLDLRKQFRAGEDFEKRMLRDNFDYLRQLRFLHELSDSGQIEFAKIALNQLHNKSPNSHFVDPVGNGLRLGL